jgi:hypothetical protein
MCVPAGRRARRAEIDLHRQSSTRGATAYRAQCLTGFRHRMHHHRIPMTPDRSDCGPQARVEDVSRQPGVLPNPGGMSNAAKSTPEIAQFTPVYGCAKNVESSATICHDLTCFNVHMRWRDSLRKSIGLGRIGSEGGRSGERKTSWQTLERVCHGFLPQCSLSFGHANPAVDGMAKQGRRVTVLG